MAAVGRAIYRQFSRRADRASAEPGACRFGPLSVCPHCGTRLGGSTWCRWSASCSCAAAADIAGHRSGCFTRLVELAAIAVALWAVLADPDPGRVWVDCGLGWTLLTLAWIDWTDFLLPDVLTLPLLLAGLASTLDLRSGRTDRSLPRRYLGLFVVPQAWLPPIAGCAAGMGWAAAMPS